MSETIMPDFTVAEFCEIHDACKEGRDWALAECETMQDVWQTAKPEWLLWVATRLGVLSDRELRLFACWCVRQVWHLLTDERSRHVVEVAERFARGDATEAELNAARAAAWAAESDAARAAASDAAWTAAWSAASAAARAASSDAAWAAASDAAWAAAWSASSAAASDVARAAQATHLRATFTPNFSRT